MLNIPNSSKYLIRKYKPKTGSEGQRNLNVSKNLLANTLNLQQQVGHIQQQIAAANAAYQQIAAANNNIGNNKNFKATNPETNVRS